MNFQRLPDPRSGVPAPIDPAREVDVPYRGGHVPEPEGRGSLRHMLVKYINLAFKYKWLILAACAVSLLYGFINTLTATKIYSASTTVRIERTVPKLVQGQRDMVDYTPYDPNFYNTQFELIRSRAMAERIATALNIGATDFLDGGPPSFWSRLMGRAAKPPTELDAATIRARQAAAVGAIQGGLSIQPIPIVQRRSHSLHQLRSAMGAADQRRRRRAIRALRRRSALWRRAAGARVPR